MLVVDARSWFALGEMVKHIVKPMATQLTGTRYVATGANRRKLETKMVQDNARLNTRACQTVRV